MLVHFVLISAFLFVSCTSAAPTERIVNGTNATIGQFPYQVALLDSETGGNRCGGSIISANYILTAAHCVVKEGTNEPNSTEFFKVRVGSIHLNSGGKLLELKSIIINENYDGTLYDLALLELEHRLNFSKYIHSIELASEEVPSGEDVIISGWGRLYFGGPNPDILQWTTLTALNNDQCKEAIGLAEDSLICLAHQSNNGACNGDSGGPAVYNGKLVGLANFATNGCASEFPDAYAKVAFHRDWILANIGE